MAAMRPVVLLLSDGEVRTIEVMIDRQRFAIGRRLAHQAVSARTERELRAFLAAIDEIAEKIRAARKI